MDEFSKFLASLLGPEVAAALNPEPTQADLQVESFQAMYPSFPTGEQCADPGCPCGGRGQRVLSSAVN